MKRLAITVAAGALVAACGSGNHPRHELACMNARVCASLQAQHPELEVIYYPPNSRQALCADDATRCTP